MTRMTAKDFAPELLELYDFYAHGQITKREFLDRAGNFAVGGLTAMTILGMMSPNYAMAEQVPFTDPEIVPEYVMYPSPNGHGEVRAYMVKPAGATGKLPAVVVVLVVVMVLVSTVFVTIMLSVAPIAPSVLVIMSLVVPSMASPAFISVTIALASVALVVSVLPQAATASAAAATIETVTILRIY